MKTGRNGIEAEKEVEKSRKGIRDSARRDRMAGVQDAEGLESRKGSRGSRRKNNNNNLLNYQMLVVTTTERPGPSLYRKGFYYCLLGVAITKRRIYC
jgi:hypothetical protein